ncbi:MAG: hypothetical protein R3B48_12390 [Kofleriaceae bacterium]
MFAPGRVAWAQDEEDEDDESAEEASGDESEEEASEEEGSEEESTESEGEESEEAPDGGRWPRAVIARPLTLPKGLIRLGAALTANNDFSVLSLGLDAGYGVSDDLEVRLGYTFGLKPSETKGNLSFGAGYKVIRGGAGGKLEVIGRGATGYSALLEQVTPLVLGAQVQYNISDKLAVVAPGEQLVISLAETAGVRPIFLRLPVGVGFQATPEAYLEVSTNIANVEIADSTTAFIFADATPISLTATYNAIPQLDVYAGISTDLTNEPGDALSFTFGANYYMGSL